MKEATRKLLAVATQAAKNQVSEAEITDESWKFHSERIWVAVDVEHGYVFVADLGDEERLIVYKHQVHHALSPERRAKDPIVAGAGVKENKTRTSDKSKSEKRKK